MIARGLITIACRARWKRVNREMSELFGVNHNGGTRCSMRLLGEIRLDTERTRDPPNQNPCIGSAWWMGFAKHRHTALNNASPVLLETSDLSNYAKDYIIYACSILPRESRERRRDDVWQRCHIKYALGSELSDSWSKKWNLWWDM